MQLSVLGLTLHNSYQCDSHPILKYSYFCVFAGTQPAMVVDTAQMKLRGILQIK